jgi:flagellar basal-body rod protein FlgC
MSDLLSSMQSSVSGMTAQSMRLRVSSENIANSDTLGYHGKIVRFAQVAAGDGTSRVVSGPPELSNASLDRIYAPGHPLADAEGYYDGSNVNLMVEIADAREAQRSYEANLKMFDQARAMSSSLLDLLRR